MTDPTQQPRLVVGVGAAAGGLDAFKQLLAALTGDTGMAFLLVQHLDPNHKSLLAELLAACTEMTVTDADQGVELRPNTVYIIRPDTSLAVQDGRIELSMPTLHRGVRLPVDHLFRSLAHDYGARATGIVLSGAGSDGSAGLRDIKGVGGLTIAQCPESSGQTGMPRSAIDTGLVDLVLEISEMPAALERFANLPPGAITEPSCGECEGERDGESGERLKCLDKQKIGQLAALLEAHANFDPRVYKSSTIERRVLRRMALSGHEEIDAYLDHLRESQLEQQTLVRDMLIGVTEFFRDSGAFRALRERVLDPLARKVPSGKTLRVWVPACSTGEEAYSIGMELLDALESVGKPATVQVFATDIDQESLALALPRAPNRRTEERDGEEAAADLSAPAQHPPGTDLARQALLEALVPPTVIVGEDASVLFLHGEFGPYLRFPQGDKPRLELSALLRPGLATRARGALHRCRHGAQPVEVLSDLEQGQQERVRITAKPAPALGNGAVMLTFERVEEAQVEPSEGLELTGQEAVIDELERELQATREDLRNTVEALETYNEELRSSNEASMSINEELQSANEELEAKNRRLELVWQTARGGIYEHRVPFDESTYYSDQWARILGYRQEELPQYQEFLTWLVEEVVHSDDRARLEQTYAYFIEGRCERYQVEARMRHRAGHWVWVRTIAQALERDTGGRVRHVLGMMLDITDLKQTEAAVRESEQRFREMTDGLPLIVWVHDALGQQEYVNATYCEFFGVTGEEMKGGRWQMLLHPDDADTYNREFYACVEAHRPFHREARVKDRHGRWRWIESWGRPRLTADGKFHGFVGTSADITSRKEMDLALQESEERFRTLADNIAQLAWMAERSGRVFWYNKRWYDYTGTSLKEVEGWGWRKLHHPDHVERVVEKLTACFASGEVWEDTFPLRGADGQYCWFLSRALPIKDARGEVVRWFGTNTDVTEQRDAEQRLVQADQQKDEFLAMLGHELRNPLAALRSASELINIGTDADPMLRHTRDVLDRQTTHMAKLLDGLLDVSRVMRGKIVLERTLVDLSEICREIADDFARRLDNEPLEFSYDLPSEPVWIDGDRVRLTQVVENLLSNAVKFSNPGCMVGLSLQRDAAVAVLRVRDTGAGIVPEHLPLVFGAFWQSTHTVERGCGGLGLGLALVKSLVQLHDGSIEARSEGAGLGAEFVARLPLTSPPATTEVMEASAPTQALRILVIEDNADVAQMLGEVLRAVGHETAEAHNGSRGIELAREFAPDVILCDLGLPDAMSGFEVARALRADAATAGIALVAVSGYGGPSDRRQSEEAGFDAHLTKPVGIEALTDVLARLRPP